MRRLLPLLVLLALLAGCGLPTAETPEPSPSPTPAPYPSSCTLEEAQPIFEAHKEELELFRSELTAVAANFQLGWWGEDGALTCSLSPLDGGETISTGDWSEVEDIFPHIRDAAELVEALGACSLTFSQYGEREEAYTALRLNLAYWFYQEPGSDCGAYSEYSLLWTATPPEADFSPYATSLGDGWYYQEMHMP